MKYKQYLVIFFSTLAIVGVYLAYSAHEKSSCSADCQSKVESVKILPPNDSVKAVGALTGRITLSPTCPVERIPRNPKCAPKPFATILNVFFANGLFLQVHTDQNGVFLLHLPVGHYSISPDVSGPYPRCDLQKVTIISKSTTTLNISCDTGIR